MQHNSNFYLALKAALPEQPLTRPVLMPSSASQIRDDHLAALQHYVYSTATTFPYNMLSTDSDNLITLASGIEESINIAAGKQRKALSMRSLSRGSDLGSAIRIRYRARGVSSAYRAAVAALLWGPACSPCVICALSPRRRAAASAVGWAPRPRCGTCWRACCIRRIAVAAAVFRGGAALVLLCECELKVRIALLLLLLQLLVVPWCGQR